MKFNGKFKYLCLLSISAAAISCSNSDFSIEGKIDGGEGKTVILEKADNYGQWVALDSTKLGDKGNFRFSGQAPEASEIYRLALDGNYVYFPVDSIEHLTFSAPADRFATDFTLEGSENAVNMATFEKELLSASHHLNIPDSAAAFKRRVFTKYLQNAQGSIVSYYILTKTVNGKPLFDSAEDSRFIAAVATSFRQFRPNDPRCDLLERAAKEGLKRKNSSKGIKRTLEAEEIGYFPISLPDESGKEVSLSEIAGKGRPVVLVFQDMSASDAADFNKELKAIYEGGRADIYSIGLDADQLIWRNAAKNLPFTTVYANVSEAGKVCTQYQVTSLPTIFIIGSNGSIIGRPADIAALKKAL